MAGRRLHGVLATLAGLAALALAMAPAVVAFGLGWMSLGWSSGTESFGYLVDENSIEAWTLLALAFLAWVPLVMAGLIVVLDRLGQHYTPLERTPRPKKSESRRRRAGMRVLAARETPAAPKKSPAAPKTTPAVPKKTPVRRRRHRPRRRRHRRRRRSTPAAPATLKREPAPRGGGGEV